MAKHRGRRRKMPAPDAADPFEDDRGLAKRKLRQLCRQVERALSTALGDQPELLDLLVDQVLPWPNASRLLVAVRPAEPGAELDRLEVLERLDRSRGELRSVVASAICRKRTPELCFEVFGDAVPVDALLDR